MAKEIWAVWCGDLMGLMEMERPRCIFVMRLAVRDTQLVLDLYELLPSRSAEFTHEVKKPPRSPTLPRPRQNDAIDLQTTTTSRYPRSLNRKLPIHHHYHNAHDTYSRRWRCWSLLRLTAVPCPYNHSLLHLSLQLPRCLLLRLQNHLSQIRLLDLHPSAHLLQSRSCNRLRHTLGLHCSLDQGSARFERRFRDTGRACRERE